jgi:hypothetical protein
VIFLMALVPVLLQSFLIVRFWRSLANLGFASEVISRAPSMLPLDAVSGLLAAMVAYWGLHTWTGFMLPILQREPFGDGASMFMAMLCCFSSMAVTYFNASDRFTTPTLAGMRESAVRTVVTLRILDTAEDVVLASMAKKGVAL